ncbi:hypothetical protein OG21DRAFT_1515136 [Imleria badia]|nr:hypothetical protein OG21DRAFT_1515136 [Imleria badia]
MMSQAILTDRLRSLFRIGLSKFVIPTLSSIVQLIVIFVVGGGPFVGDVILVNGMLSVYGVVFASVWAGKEHRWNLEEAKQYLYAKNRGRNRPHMTPSVWERGKWRHDARSMQ